MISPQGDGRIRHRIPPWPYLAIAGLLIAAECGIWAVGLRVGSPDRVRALAVNWAGFWPGVLGDWQANFGAQPITMFASYWLIHAGPLHLAGNLLVLAWFALRMGPDLRRSETIEIWMGAVLGGALAFALLSQSSAPMIGASGGVFGLLGAYVVIDHNDRHRDAGRRAAVLRTALVCGTLLILSLVDFTLRDSVLAWQAHLGGFVTGAALTLALAPTGRAVS